MNRTFVIIAGIIVSVVIAFAVLGFWGSADWGSRSEITRVVPGQNGETLIIQEGGRRGFFPAFPFFLFVPLLWILVIGGLFSFFGRRRWGGGPGFGPGPRERQAWLDDWHRRQHAGSVSEPANAQAEQAPPES